MDSQTKQPKPCSKIELIESGIDQLLNLSVRIMQLSGNIFNKLLGQIAEEQEEKKDAKNPTGKLETIRDRLDTAITRLSIAESDLKSIDKETE